MAFLLSFVYSPVVDSLVVKTYSCLLTSKNICYVDGSFVGFNVKQ
jgi:hypothetical protein